MAAGDIIVVNENCFGKKANVYDGVDDYMLADAHAVARVAANDTVGTYTAWIYADEVDSEQAILSAGDNNSADEFLQFFIQLGQLRVQLNHGGTTQFEVRETTGSIQKKTWIHVGVVQNGTSPALYVNGKAVALTNSAAVDLTFWYDELTLVDKFAIGVKESNATHTNDFKGAIGRVQYFNIPFTASEMLENYKDDGYLPAERATAIEAARVFDITCNDDGTTDDGSGADNGTLTGGAHYGGEVSAYSLAMERNVTGHAAEDINSFPVADRILSIIKRGD